MEPRKNQVEPIRLGVEFFRKKAPKPSIMVLPTAWGKSLLSAFIAKELKEKLLIIQPSKELLDQNLDKFLKLGGEAKVYSASKKSKEIGDITYATIGSIKSLGATFKSLGISKIIIDEVHLFPRGADGMLSKFIKEACITHILGLTATPLKLQTNSFNQESYSLLKMLTSRSKHGNLFKDILYVSQIQEMVELGFWTKLKYEIFDFNTESLRFNTTKAEFTNESLRLAYFENNVGPQIVDYIKKSSRKSILVAVPTVDEALSLAAIVPSSVAVYGDMPEKERDEAVRDFKELKIRVVFQVNVMSTGFDHPELDCLIMGRSTASIAWYYQFLGRGTRIHPNKEDCLIADFSGNTDKFGKVEHLYFKKVKNLWHLYGEGGKLLTGIDMTEIGQHFDGPKPLIIEIGKYTGKHIDEIPKDYLIWVYKNWKFTTKNQHIKVGIKEKFKL